MAPFKLNKGHLATISKRARTFTNMYLTWLSKSAREDCHFLSCLSADGVDLEPFEMCGCWKSVCLEHFG